MNAEHRQAAMDDELALARGALAAARLLLAHGLFPDVLNRTYYAAHHAARALLFSRGIEVRSHSGLRSEFSRHFVKAGLLPTSLAKTLKSLQAEREEADYGRFVVIDREEAELAVTDAAAFVEAAEMLLREEGWSDASSNTGLKEPVP